MYGWKQTYYEARKGDTLTLNVGTIKGSPRGRVLFEVGFNVTGENVKCTSMEGGAV